MTKYKDRYTTKSATPKDIDKDWFLVDADGALLGRMASKVAKIIRGKHKTNYTPHMDCGDNVVIINASKIKFSGDKLNQKQYINILMATKKYTKMIVLGSHYLPA